MTELAREGIFSVSRALLLGAAVLAIQFQLSGCASTSESAPLVTAPPSSASSGQAVNTGTYPNLNIAPQVAAPQLSDEEKNAKLAGLKAVQNAQAAKGGGGEVPNDETLLKKLAATHGQKTLSEIEGK
ncbi:hypothetical protein [Pseudaminobacter soli (ex Li et al. 2025)]|uniref:Uncharacterized protein n=1 Tax=Pseudaminobacter soli (ex Li et al. 2025) TaxID=1295366 RepID=A0A2P7SBC3_9HYPH|nr:hypothetical protein [Mesorhizobium soli]PSJ59768.1 hypothetical protein C7I85_15605 [Mesorhizobium soli]